MEEFFNEFLKCFEFDEHKVDSYSPLVLAYIGDAVYEVFVRTFVISKEIASVNTLHKKSIKFVKSKAQSEILNKITQHLYAEEVDIVRRGRNAKSATIPKNANIIEYKYATGFESLIGYLYLKKRYSRLLEIMIIAVKS